MPRVDAPQLTLRPRRFGLLAQVEVDDRPDGHWETGVHWMPDLAVTDRHVASPECAWPTEMLKTVNTFPDLACGDPFYVWRSAACRPNDTVPNLATAARRALERHEGADVESALWSGIPDPADPSSPLADQCPYLASSDSEDVGGGLASMPLDALGLLAAELGQRGGEVIHAPLQLMPYFFHLGVVVRDGRSIQTADGSFEVIFGHGYDGSGPDGNPPGPGTVWMYGTGPIRVLRSDVRVDEAVHTTGLGGANEDDQLVGQFRIARAERTYVIQRDPSAALAVLVDVSQAAS